MLPEVVACLACPHCGAPLSAVDAALRCAAGHSFDVARQGYVTLLPRGARPGAEAGDSAAMVAARASFLAAGHYAPLTDALTAAVAAAPPGPVLDLGAGTAHHLAATLDPRAPEPPTPDPPVPGTAAGPVAVGAVAGSAAVGVAAGPAAAGTGAGPGARGGRARVGIAVDLSRYAARRAARAHPLVGAVVADAWRALPVRDGAVAAVLGVFAPRNGPETARVLRPDGVLVVVTPAAGHLAELVNALGLLAVDADKDARVAAALEPHLTPVARDRLSWTLSLSRADAIAAVAMGPSARHLTADDLARRVAALPDPVTVTAAMDVRTYRPG